jgi:LPXTG-motif cell wall-anchored protein
MKRVKRFLSLFMAAIMVLAMAAVVPVKAATQTYTITLVNAVSGHTYTAYKIFTGNVSTGTSQLGTPISWADADKGAALLAKLKDSGETKLNNSEGKNYYASATTAEDVVKILANSSSDAEIRFAQLADEVFGEGDGDSSSDGSVTKKEIGGKNLDVTTISNLTAGYYLIKDTTANLSANVDVTRLITNVSSAGTIYLKVDSPSLEKKVANTLDGNYSKGVVAEAGQKVYFSLIADIPDSIRDYTSYQILFHDTLADGLKFNQIEKVYISKEGSLNDYTVGPALTADNYTLATESLTDDCSFELSIKDIISNSTLYNFFKSGTLSNATLVVKYSAILTKDAVAGSTGNLNEAYMNYTNRPNVTATSDTKPTGETPKDYAKVFTFKIDATKKDAENQNTKLGGAEFVVYKLDATDTSKKLYMVEDSSEPAGMAWKELSDANISQAKVFTSSSTEDNLGKFEISGLGAGTYFIKETKAPSTDAKAYSVLEKDLQIVVSASVKDKTADQADTTDVSEIDTFTAKETSVNTSGTTLTTDSTEGSIAVDVLDGAGSSMPTTGGIGTTIFYVLGMILVAGSAVLLIVRKRMSVEK